VAFGKLHIPTIVLMRMALQDWIAARGARVLSKHDNPMDSVAEIVFEDAECYGGRTFRIEIKEIVT